MADEAIQTTPSAPQPFRSSDELLPIVYEQLRRLAERRLAEELPEHSLQATALVHEAYLRLLGEQDRKQANWEGCAHFYSAAAEAMRRILVEHARRKNRLKRGGGRERVPWNADFASAPEEDENLVALDEAMTLLAKTDPVAVELVKLRYFAGLTLTEAAATLGIASRTADRLWSYARAWLHREVITRSGDDENL